MKAHAVLLCRFGAVALGLQLIPFVGMVFGFTSTVGAALWASELEKKGKSRSGAEANQPSRPGDTVAPEKEVQVEI